MARIALAIFRLEPRGGLEDHCIRIAEELVRRGHEVTIFTTVGSNDGGIPATILEASDWRWTNHGRMRRFARLFAEAAAGHDRTVAFQPIPGADILFCADLPRNRADSPLLKRLTPRFRAYAALERACFSPAAKTRIICLARPQADQFHERYGTPSERIAILPPSIDKAKRRPEWRNPATRRAAREALGVPEGACTWLWLGLQPAVKGLDRVIGALATHPEAHLLIAGLSGDDRRAGAIQAQAKALSAGGRMHWLGYLDRDRMLEAIAAADVLAHPARTEVTGGVILEAMINGLPVVTTANCGFAEHVTASGGGIVLPIPFDAQRFSEALTESCGDANRQMSARGIAYGGTAPLYDGIAAAADLVESPLWPVAAPIRSREQ